MKRVIIFGYNRLSMEAISNLDAEVHDVLLVDQSESRLALAEENGYKTAVCDYRDDDDLRAIGIGVDVDTIFCFFLEDSENVFLTISARALDDNLNIIAIVEDPNSEEKLIAAGANKVINPYQICGWKIHEMIKKPSITHIMDNTVFGRHDLHVVQVDIPKDSFLENTYSSELKLGEKYNLVLLGVVDKEIDDRLHFTLGELDHQLNAGDILVILGPSREIRAFKKDVEHVKQN